MRSGACLRYRGPAAGGDAGMTSEGKFQRAPGQGYESLAAESHGPPTLCSSDGDLHAQSRGRPGVETQTRRCGRAAVAGARRGDENARSAHLTKALSRVVPSQMARPSSGLPNRPSCCPDRRLHAPLTKIHACRCRSAACLYLNSGSLTARPPSCYHLPPHAHPAHSPIPLYAAHHDRDHRPCRRSPHVLQAGQKTE